MESWYRKRDPLAQTLGKDSMEGWLVPYDPWMAGWRYLMHTRMEGKGPAEQGSLPTSSSSQSRPEVGQAAVCGWVGEDDRKSWLSLGRASKLHVLIR